MSDTISRHIISFILVDTDSIYTNIKEIIKNWTHNFEVASSDAKH